MSHNPCIVVQCAVKGRVAMTEHGMRWARKSTPRARCCLAVALLLCANGMPQRADAEPRKQVELRDYRVYGRTARDLVSYMKSRPFHGDYGPAMANIRPKYQLNLKTRQSKRGCAVRSLSVTTRFVVTIPKAVEARKFDRHTRRVWRAFRRFTIRHENVHKRIYLGCVRRFTRRARRIGPQSSCMGLRYRLRRDLDAADKACDRLHRTFDRRSFRRVRHLALFRRARAERGRRRFARRNGARVLPRGQAMPNWFTYVGRTRDR